MVALPDDTEILTLGWLRKQALIWLLGFIGVALVATWRLSAQTADLKRDVAEAKAAIPEVVQQVQSLNEEVRLLRKGQDSLITLMTDRERRSPSRNVLGGRQ